MIVNRSVRTNTVLPHVTYRNVAWPENSTRCRGISRNVRNVEVTLLLMAQVSH
jgi:hypothetical protein